MRDKGFIHFIFVLSFSFGTLQAATDESNCLNILQRLTQASADLVLSSRFAVTAPQAELVGNKSLHTYKADWSAHIDPQRSYSQLALSYVSAGGEEATLHIKLNPWQKMRAPTQEVKIGENTALREDQLDENPSSGEAHLLHWDLPRNLEGNFIDLNIAEEALRFLASKSIMHERYSFVLNDPGVVTALNQKLAELLESIEFKSDIPRIAGTEDDPLAEHHYYDTFQDSYFPSIPKTEVEAILRALRRHLGLDKELASAFLKTDLGEHVQKSGEWDIQIQIEGFSLAEALELQDSELLPYVFKYRVVLTSRW